MEINCSIRCTELCCQPNHAAPLMVASTALIMTKDLWKKHSGTVHSLDTGVFLFWAEINQLSAAGATQTLTWGGPLKGDTMAWAAFFTISVAGSRATKNPLCLCFLSNCCVTKLLFLPACLIVNRRPRLFLLYNTGVFVHMCTHMLVWLIPFIRPVNPLTASSNPEQALPLIKPTPLPPEDASPPLAAEPLTFQPSSHCFWGYFLPQLQSEVRGFCWMSSLCQNTVFYCN